MTTTESVVVRSTPGFTSRGTVASIHLGEVMVEIVVEVGEHEIVSVITRGSVEELGLDAGDEVAVFIKSTEVMIAR